MVQQPLRILLADDETDIREPLAKYLRQRQGCHVDAVADAKAAMSRLEETKGNYDVILLDDLLVPEPGQNPEPLAVFLTKEFRARYPRIEIIVFTGKGMEPALETLRAGAYRYLIKPLNFEELEMLIQMAVEHRRLKGVVHQKQILEQLMETSAALHGVRSLPEVLDIILHGVHSIGYDRVCLYLLSEDRQRMVGQAQVGVGQEFIGHERLVATDIQMQALLADPRPQVFERNRDQLPPYEQRPTWEGANQWACVPLIFKGEVIGKLSMDNKFSQHPIEGSALGPVALFASQAAVALRNAKLLDQVSLARNTAKAVAEVTTLENIAETLSSVVKGIRKALGCDAVTLYVYHQNKDELVHPPTMTGVRYPERAFNFLEIARHSIVFKILRQDQLYIVDNVTLDPLFKETHFAADEQIKSCVALPLKVGMEKVGVMFINYRRLHRFSTDELTNIELFANQAAVAIRNAQLYQQVSRRLEEVDALQQVAISLAGASNLDEVLSLILTESKKLTDTYGNTILLWDTRLGKFTQALKLNENGILQPYINQTRPEVKLAHKIIAGQEPIIISDVRQVPDLNPDHIEKGDRALLGVPLLSHGEAIGVLYMRGKKPRVFSDRQVALGQALASQAAVAIARACQYEELKGTKGLVGARTALAWMGMANSAWRHSIEGYAINIRHTITLLRQKIRTAFIDLTAQQLVKANLDLIEKLAIQILDKPITPPLSSEEGIEVVRVDDLIHERIDQLWENEQYRGVTPYLDLKSPADTRVQISPEWLRRALDLLVDNAVEAMAGAPVCQLNIATRLVKDQLEIAIQDTGQGIPAGVYPKLFRERIAPSESHEGLGMGLLIVQAIVQTYGGDIHVKDTSSQGTTMIISLPVIQKNGI